MVRPRKFTDDDHLVELSDEDFMASRARTRPYTVCILKKGPNYEPPGTDFSQGVPQIIYQHGKRNTRLRLSGLLPVVCPLPAPDEMAGVGIFNCSVEEADRIMSTDPAVMAGVLTYHLYQTRALPGSALPDPDQS
ncbi:MAG TPA: hypothetical protein VEK76_08615 [Candidatus Binatia bacterium]|nr:hypothetical protein [Candidatus Binatia bacterium]